MSAPSVFCIPFYAGLNDKKANLDVPSKYRRSDSRCSTAEDMAAPNVGFCPPNYVNFEIRPNCYPPSRNGGDQQVAGGLDFLKHRSFSNITLDGANSVSTRESSSDPLVPLTFLSKGQLCLREILTVLKDIPNERIFVVRRTNRLGFEAEITISDYFSNFGEVEKVLMLPSRAVKSKRHFNKAFELNGNEEDDNVLFATRSDFQCSKTRLRPGSMGFVVMVSEQAVMNILERKICWISGQEIEVGAYSESEEHKLSASNHMEIAEQWKFSSTARQNQATEISTPTYHYCDFPKKVQITNDSRYDWCFDRGVTNAQPFGAKVASKLNDVEFYGDSATNCDEQVANALPFEKLPQSVMSCSHGIVNSKGNGPEPYASPEIGALQQKSPRDNPNEKQMLHGELLPILSSTVAASSQGLRKSNLKNCEPLINTGSCDRSAQTVVTRQSQYVSPSISSLINLPVPSRRISSPAASILGSDYSGCSSSTLENGVRVSRTSHHIQPSLLPVRQQQLYTRNRHHITSMDSESLLGPSRSSCICEQQLLVPVLHQPGSIPLRLSGRALTVNYQPWNSKLVRQRSRSSNCNYPADACKCSSHHPSQCRRTQQTFLLAQSPFPQFGKPPRMTNHCCCCHSPPASHRL